MSLFDKIRKNATKVVDQHGDKISRGLDTVAEKVDKRTGGKHSDKITKGVSKAKEGLDRLDSKRDHDLGGPGDHPSRRDTSEHSAAVGAGPHARHRPDTAALRVPGRADGPGPRSGGPGGHEVADAVGRRVVVQPRCDAGALLRFRGL
jgi:hypothetical protein